MGAERKERRRREPERRRSSRERRETDRKTDFNGRGKKTFPTLFLPPPPLPSRETGDALFTPSVGRAVVRTNGENAKGKKKVQGNFLAPLDAKSSRVFISDRG